MQNGFERIRKWDPRSNAFGWQVKRQRQIREHLSCDQAVQDVVEDLLAYVATQRSPLVVMSYLWEEREGVWKWTGELLVKRKKDRTLTCYNALPLSLLMMQWYPRERTRNGYLEFRHSQSYWQGIIARLTAIPGFECYSHGRFMGVRVEDWSDEWNQPGFFGWLPATRDKEGTAHE